jgi:hypothetical protein
MCGIVIPTMFVSWLLPFSFIAYLFGLMGDAWATRSLGAEELASWHQIPIAMPAERKAQRIKSGWAAYILAGGLAWVLIDLSDQQPGLLLLQGGWEIVCGLAIYLLPQSWWSSCCLMTEEVHPFWQAAGVKRSGPHGDSAILPHGHSQLVDRHNQQNSGAPRNERAFWHMG